MTDTIKFPLIFFRAARGALSSFAGLYERGALSLADKQAFVDLYEALHDEGYLNQHKDDAGRYINDFTPIYDNCRHDLSEAYPGG